MTVKCFRSWPSSTCMPGMHESTRSSCSSTSTVRGILPASDVSSSISCSLIFWKSTVAAVLRRSSKLWRAERKKDWLTSIALNSYFSLVLARSLEPVVTEGRKGAHHPYINKYIVFQGDVLGADSSTEQRETMECRYNRHGGFPRFRLSFCYLGKEVTRKS